MDVQLGSQLQSTLPLTWHKADNTEDIGHWNMEKETQQDDMKHSSALQQMSFPLLLIL